jgi:broad specificity phosphatase PhoE
LKRVILLRHFRVKDACEKKLFSSLEIDAWVDFYDRYDLDYHDISLPRVDRVYTSALLRAKRSAEYLGLAYQEDALFNEVEAKAFVDTRWRFPKFFWLLFGRILWSFNLVKRSETKSDTLARVKEATRRIMIDDSEHIMIVSHGFFMILLVRELRKNGFEGEMDRHPKNGILYTFQKNKVK